MAREDILFFKNTGVWANQGVESAVDSIISCFSIEQRKYLEITSNKGTITFREQLIDAFSRKHPSSSHDFLEFHVKSFINDNPHKFRSSNKLGEISQFFLEKISTLFVDGPNDLVAVEKLKDDYL